MSSTPQSVRGMQSLLGEEADRFHEVVAAFDRVRRLYGFRRVKVPVLEQTQVFARTMGETTDVVSKEMYSFEDKGGEQVTLRPEFTAGIARAFLSEGWQQHIPLKVATHGPAFRYERPQKGRFRQFHQLDAEIIGPAEPQADIELLAFADQLLKELGLGETAILKLNTLGDPATRAAWRNALHEHFAANVAALSEDSRTRLDRNPLRILDSKAHQDWPIVDSAPTIDEFLTAEAAEFFGELTEGLDRAGVRWERAPRLVRGLDYYRHTAFEFITDTLGAQGTVLAGGRYDGLIETLGGPHTPAVGWAAGIERLAMMIDAPQPERPDAAIVPMGEAAERRAAILIADLRRAGIAADLGLRGNMKKRMQRANASGARFAIIIGDSELEAGEAQLKDLASGEQRAVAFDLLASEIGR
ncbi:histidine--tRNA ligase [Sphingomonas xanthus]|uniref:Histidine--tRNA ligase n=1 Tax=Sphingomonas xanthus TaxID=2594473 RepID=A0A516IRZ3_9SPHN|nr:histidine--tRNA ligase [Sphingomonas xanthus]QDP19640.1 histidine--tRNA ligase [Sphingomonas xanthus]